MSGLKLTGWLAIGAGVAFFAADAYLFGVMGSAGFTIDMFDLPGTFLPWLFDHQAMYQGLWSLYFVSQALLLLVPWRLGEALRERSAGVLGAVSVTIAIVGLVFFFATSPVVASAYHDKVDPGSVLALHDATADLGKDLRLFSEVLLGVWLVAVGHQLRVRTGRRPWWTVTVLGGWTLVVAAWKLFDPQMPLEDWLGFLLGAGYVGLGVALLRTRLPVHPSVPTATTPDLEAAGAGP
jgi:hypothetical protein